jgi:uncharacterized protein (TIGR02679 family)
VTCRLCDGTCADGRLAGLLTDDLAWLWAQLADAADRRGDPRLITGTVPVTPPHSASGRAAATGLLGRRHIPAGRVTRVDLAKLAATLAPLTPGAVAAHSTGRRLALRAINRARRAATEDDVRCQLDALLPGAATDNVWAVLRRAKWVRRLVDADDRASLVATAADVISRLPTAGDPPLDRRLLARAAVGDPHALDSGRPVAGLTLALLAALGRAPASGPPRERWAAVGVASDDIIGGLTVVGITPVGWAVPPGAPVTLPPRVLATCNWPPGDGAVVFVTENPSVLGAAADIPGARIICTSGTPSGIEVDALARLARQDWRLRVRADFDDAGLNHVIAVLAAAPGAEPWRMNTADYLHGLDDTDAVALRVDRLGHTPWDPDLAAAMGAHSIAVYEETYLDHLAADVAASVR